MTARTRRELLLLGALVIVLLVVGLAQFRDGGETAGTTAPPSNPVAAQAGGASSESPVADVRLERLETARQSAAETERNPFRFRPKPVPVPAVRPEPRVEDLPPPMPAGPPPPPPIPLRFIGLVEGPAPAGRVAILSDGRGNVFYGKEGDIIEGRYRVLKIGTESAELAYTDGRGRQTLRLSGQ